MRHDYDLPPDWAAMTAQERDDWFHQERCKRQSMRQDTPFRRHVEKERERAKRRAEARNGHELGWD